MSLPAILFSGYPLDRASERRREADWIAGLLADPGSDLVLLDRGRPVLDVTVGEDGAQGPLRLSVAARAALLGEDAATLFMGLEGDGRAVFAAQVPQGVELDVGPLQGLGEAVEMRAAAMGPLRDGDLALMGTARAIFEWHGSHGFCSKCGHATDITDAGWKRVCPACKTEHFPRTDPVAIMLPVRDGQCFLARSARFPRNFVSCLAGFIEPGETFGEACTREVFEEAGLRVTTARYVADQPWPFPSQLMIGLIADVADGPVTLATEELAEGHWFTRDEARALLSPSGVDKEGRTFNCPPRMAIAHWIVRAWVDQA
ncbi:MAG: NAD(+) diphosphatase [Hyphomonadaceae bacterium]|nr:NAD(+) diphosphatase [Hyphomonadaceae bacterium]